MITLLIWFTSSIGKTVMKWTSFAAVAIAVYWKIYADGQAAERAKQVAKQMDAVRERERIRDGVSQMPDADVRRELRDWVRDDR
ncbi:hypothetical protein [Gellertiella hungarica]|uniref:Uncharacterized protein n=1 Tax=Gellertiella hungarica TaxID=1572859 RepID=A0A7W6J3F2_9HYPH|nr:hypothetical protein [Gellertiella hungarica]MBB4064064.1 hypothetical protein [Gellertiella hungarica]